MLESLFNYPTVLTRHRNAPLFEERDRYLRHRAQQGCAHGTLLRIARELLQIVHRLDTPSEWLITVQQVNTAAERWARQQCRRGRAHSFKWSRELFVQVAADWLQFLGRLDKPTAKPLPFEGVIEEFCRWMSAERGLSSVTVRNYSWHLKQFLKWCKEHDHPWPGIQLSDVDAFLSSWSDKGWCRISIATSAKTLKVFFRYAGQRGRCHPMIAPAIQGPRLFSQDSLPSGPSWKEVERLIGCMAPDQPRDIRDRAILLLFALYGLRSSEVARLRLEDIDLESSRLSVYRSKQRKAQTYPLTSTVGHAIIRYLRTVRQQSSHREIFLTDNAQDIVDKQLLNYVPNDAVTQIG